MKTQLMFLQTACQHQQGGGLREYGMPALLSNSQHIGTLAVMANHAAAKLACFKCYRRSAGGGGQISGVRVCEWA